MIEQWVNKKQKLDKIGKNREVMKECGMQDIIAG